MIWKQKYIAKLETCNIHINIYNKHIIKHITEI